MSKTGTLSGDIRHPQIFPTAYQAIRQFFCVQIPFFRPFRFRRILKGMNAPTLVGYYLIWHYGPAWVDLIRVGQNLLWFVYHIFSVPILIKTFFSPWKRLTEEPKGNIITDTEGVVEAFIVTTLMRIAGVIARACMLVVAVGLLAALSVAGLLLFVVWVVMPVIPPILFLLGVVLLF